MCCMGSYMFGVTFCPFNSEYNRGLRSMIFYDELVILVCDSRHSLSLYLLPYLNLIRHHTNSTIHKTASSSRKSFHSNNLRRQSRWKFYWLATFKTLWNSRPWYYEETQLFIFFNNTSYTFIWAALESTRRSYLQSSRNHQSKGFNPTQRNKSTYNSTSIKLPWKAVLTHMYTDGSNQNKE